MILQQQTLLPEQDCKPSHSYQGGSLASLTALQESVKHLVTSVISGRSTEESSAKLSPDGLWLKTYQGCYQAKMDNSFEEYSEILPKWGLMLGGQLILPPRLEPCIDETGWRLLPTPVAMDSEMPPNAARIRLLRMGIIYFYSKKSGIKASIRGLADWLNAQDSEWNGTPKLINPAFVESMMGYPIGWAR